MIINQETTIEEIENALHTAGFDAALDSDGDVYLKGSAVEYPVCVSLPESSGAIKIWTHAEMNMGIDHLQAMVFANTANASIAMPQFSVSDEEGELVLNGFYYVPYEFGVEMRTLIALVRRFAGAFRAVSSVDETGEFLA